MKDFLVWFGHGVLFALVLGTIVHFIGFWFARGVAKATKRHPIKLDSQAHIRTTTIIRR